MAGDGAMSGNRIKNNVENDLKFERGDGRRSNLSNYHILNRQTSAFLT
jgi:hypothetical protein